MKTLLLQSGYSLSSANNVWSKSDYRGIAYSDGDEVELRIAGIVSDATDLSVLSTELRQHATDWPSVYHLSSTRANILRPFQEFLIGADVLEIGAGCGAITRYLGECGANVLALEGTPRRAAIARSRTRDLPNVEVVTDSFDAFSWEEKFDVITLIGVLEYANLFTPGANPAISMLHRARAMLKPQGKLIIAIENQLGLKYFAGAPEDHLGQSMYGIEGRYRADQPQTYGRKALGDMLTQVGYKDTQFFAPFPDYKLPVSIVTEGGFSSEAFDAGALAWQSVRRDPQLPHYLAFSPELVWPTLVENDVALDLANSFLVMANNGAQAHTNSSVLAYHYSTERASGYCKETRFLQTDTGSVELQYQLLSPDTLSSYRSQLIKFSVPHTANYVSGTVLSWELIRIVTRDGWHIDEVGAFIKRYLRIVTSLVSSGTAPVDIDSVNTPLPGMCFDLVPQNIVMSADGTYQAIDSEWVLNGDIPAGWLVFRTLLLLAQTVTRFGSTASAFNDTRIGFFRAAFQSAGLSVDEEGIKSFGYMEAAVQAEVSQRPVEAFINWWSDSPLLRHGVFQVMNEHAHKLTNLNQIVAERDGEIANLNQVVANLNQVVTQCEQQLAIRDREIIDGNRSFEAIRASTSWKVTAPLRYVSSTAQKLRIVTPKARNVRAILTMLPQLLHHGGGPKATIGKAIHVLQREGLAGVKIRLINFLIHQATNQVGFTGLSSQKNLNISIIPYYIDPRLDSTVAACSGDTTVAVHLHLYNTNNLNECYSYLNNIPLHYDLYVSISNSADAESILNEFKNLLNKATNIFVEPVPEQGEDIAPLIVQFGKRLTKYEIVAHVHNKVNPQTNDLTNWMQDSFIKLMGPSNSSGGRVAHIISLLQTTAKIIFPETYTQSLGSGGGWDTNGKFENHILEKYTHFSIDNFLNIEFSENSMFWARTSCLKDLLSLPLSYNDFPFNSSTAEVARGHTYERVISIFASTHQGHYIRIHTGDSIKDYREYEDQHDYSTKVAHSDIKVLSYYLPQFHPIPENDLWHGKGFTEWTKVIAANPLFEGHYQQHIPHADIGYYLLDSPETLRRQADQMKKAGVHGQVFYHYWFAGKLILEDPAQLLLNTPDIQMPFCFCWANENWTRRWDGNENEILLGQNYSPQDAHDFIHYLIPFFKDPRYIMIEDRPVLFIYRPSSIPNAEEYLDIWERECKKNGIQRPYVVAVLTRGAINPNDFGMDAAVERVLHDWTDGAVPEIKDTLHTYRPFNGKVLSYSEVASFYMEQKEAKDFTYFRSLVPIWDNTARYGSEAYLLHGSTPQRFQEWMESSIAYTQATLPPDRRFVLVNAWNEWAEGAHLEPDTRYGYSYLNSIGRALSGIQYTEKRDYECSIPVGMKVHLSFSTLVLDQLKADSLLQQRFIHCLLQSSIFNTCSISINTPDLLKYLPSTILSGSVDSDFVFEFRKVTYFDSLVLEKLLEKSYATGSTVIGNSYDDDSPLVNVTANGSVHSSVAYCASLIVIPSNATRGSYKNCRMRTDARCYAAYPSHRLNGNKPVVTTIIRFHKSGDLSELKNALYCLYAMKDCVVIPLIAAQDLDSDKIVALKNMLKNFAWSEGFEPQVHLYHSPDGKGDLRSRMLNESLKQVKTRYAAFLDFDDLLMPSAYDWLIRRLQDTGKAVSFGRVYSTSYDSEATLLLERRRAFEYGYSYETYVQHNHAPVHSFMLDIEKLNVSQISYFDDHRYMEDYFLTLQLFTEESADWESLKENHYIGDYIHSINRSHTLAFSDEQIRQALFSNPEYMLCEERINEMRRLAVQRRSSAKSLSC